MIFEKSRAQNSLKNKKKQYENVATEDLYKTLFSTASFSLKNVMNLCLQTSCKRYSSIHLFSSSFFISTRYAPHLVHSLCNKTVDLFILPWNLGFVSIFLQHRNDIPWHQAKIALFGSGGNNVHYIASSLRHIL